jgi:hypothetical protein
MADIPDCQPQRPRPVYSADMPTPEPDPVLAAYIRDMVSHWPPLSAEQIGTLRALFDPVTLP